MQAFRGAVSPYAVVEFQLRGLDANGIYEVRYLGNDVAPKTVTGKDLAEKGLTVAINSRPDAVVVAYRCTGGK